MSVQSSLASSLLNGGTSVGGATPSSGTTGTSSKGGTSTLTQQDFLNLLTTQMQYQDPENPVSDTDFASELAQFTSLQGVQQLNTSINQMLTLQQVSQGANLIGQQVSFTGSTGSGAAGNGVVSSVQINNGAVQLTVGNQTVPLSLVTSVGAGGTGG